MTDRHPKWTRVEPGTVIPAGQPYRVENEDGYHREWPGADQPTVYHDEYETMTGLFVDSSWKPPLDLPTVPTWGIAVHRHHGAMVGSWRLGGGEFWRHRPSRESYLAHNITAFIPLTDEQVARIEAGR